MGAPSYPRPPITEAVIEVRFSEPVDLRELDEVNRALDGRYPRGERLTNIDVRVDVPTASAGPRVSTRSEFSGYKRTSQDALEIVILGQHQFLVSRLAPYPGWQAFVSRFISEWTVWKSKVGYRRLSRIGVRYINRLDLPVRDGVVHEEEYLTIRVLSPPELGNFLASASQSRFDAHELGCHITVNSGTVPSPLPNHISILLDIDVGTVDEKAVPQREDDMLVFLDKVRERKNDVFELCITDAARALFQ